MGAAVRGRAGSPLAPGSRPTVVAPWSTSSVNGERKSGPRISRLTSCCHPSDANISDRHRTDALSVLEPSAIKWAVRHRVAGVEWA